jgi:hypothetical protein
MHVHSVIYYHMHTNIIDDATFDKWAVELASLQRDFPQFKHKGYMSPMFENWTGDTGMHLPVTDATYALAQALVREAEKRNHAVVQTPKRERWEGDVGYEVNS